jgi:HD-like signal output (HDOD) protein
VTSRILFVDDDVAVLEGLRLRLRPMRDQWAMTFVQNGAQALAELQQSPYDVVVSDIRMPGIHGTRLLRTIGQRWPQTVRIAVSGFADHESTHLVPIAHQFLSKPCERPQLESVIAHCMSLQQLLPDPSLRAIVGRVQRLSPIRKTYRRLQSLLGTPGATVDEVARMIGSDPIVTAKLFHIVNCSPFPLERQLTDIAAAVRSLGLTHLRQFVMSAEVFMQWPQKVVATSLDLDVLQLHVSAVAKVAEALTVGTPLASDTVLAARLHDIGYWILWQECPRELEKAFELARENRIAAHEAERQVLGVSHAEVGAYLLGLWAFPPSVVKAIAEHHAPRRSVRETEFDPSTALAISIALSNGDDGEAIQGISPSASHLGPEYFESLRAPFDWAEAQRRAAAALG